MTKLPAVWADCQETNGCLMLINRVWDYFILPLLTFEGSIQVFSVLYILLMIYLITFDVNFKKIICTCVIKTK